MTHWPVLLTAFLSGATGVILGQGLQWLTLGLSLSAMFYYGYAIYAAADFFSQSSELDPNFHPSATILKPICGLDNDAYENLASFCQQDYPEYQIVFGVREQDDPGIAVVKQLIQNFPQLDIRLVVSDRIIGENYKVSNLANALVEARYPLLIVADSDIYVGSDYLSQVVQPFRDAAVGVVTCLYRARTQGWIAAFESLGVSTEFLPSVLVARKMEGMNFALGATIAIRKSVLEAIGGFEAIADYLGDDFMLGYLPAQAGYKVVLSDYVVDHVMATETISAFIYHQTRWLRGNRFVRPWGYLGLIFTYGIPTSLLFFLMTGNSLLGWTVLVCTWLLRLAMAWMIGAQKLGDRTAQIGLWLVPLRDCVSFALWCYSFLGDTVEWRGRRLKMTRGGKLCLLN